MYTCEQCGERKMNAIGKKQSATSARGSHLAFVHELEPLRAPHVERVHGVDVDAVGQGHRDRQQVLFLPGLTLRDRHPFQLLGEGCEVFCVAGRPDDANGIDHVGFPHAQDLPQRRVVPHAPEVFGRDADEDADGRGVLDVLHGAVRAEDTVDHGPHGEAASHLLRQGDATVQRTGVDDRSVADAVAYDPGYLLRMHLERVDDGAVREVQEVQRPFVVPAK